MSTTPPFDDTSRSRPMRWGFVGTGGIATRMARVLRTTPAAELGAVASRGLDTARSFAAEHGADRAFDSFEEMLAWSGIDAVYVATPTSVREKIGVAAAKAGKHVLAEKPFAGLPSLRRLTEACRERGVAFMDATHFVHHPRYAAIRESLGTTVGRVHALDSCFLVGLADRNDIRYDPALEPLGAIGDLGWYSMRAALEYLSPGIRLRAASTRLRKDRETGAIVAGEGSLSFDDDSVSIWRCSFLAAAVSIELELSGTRGRLFMENFVGEEADGSATYQTTGDQEETVRVDSRSSGPALMFESFAAAAREASRRPHWMQASEHTQALLDAALDAAKDVSDRLPGTSRDAGFDVAGFQRRVLVQDLLPALSRG